MPTPTTQRDEVRQLLRATSEPLTRPEIFAKCDLVVDHEALSTVLSQLVNAGEIRRVGERARDKGAPLALYTAAPGGNTTKSPARTKRKGTKPAKKPRASTSSGRSKTTRKPKPKSIERVPRNTAAAPAPDGFRCGIFSDGTLAINAEDGQITLSEPEARAMFVYLDRVLGTAAA